MSTPRTEGGPGREPLTVRIAMWSAGHRWPVVALWFIATIGLFGASLSIGGINSADASGGPNQQKIEASEAYDVFNASGTTDPPSETVVVVVGGGVGAVNDSRFQAAVGDLVAKLTDASAPLDGVATKTFDQVTDPLHAPPSADLVSPDQSTARIIGHISGDKARVEPLLPPIGPIVDAARAANPSLTIHVIDSILINHDIDGLINKGLDDTLAVTLPITFVILLLAFGAIIAALIPLVLAVTSLLAAFGILGIYSQAVGPVSPNATQLIVLIGIAVAIDYSLFMITRFRVERRAGRDRAKAIEVSSSTAGRAVFFSGLAVMISLAGLVTLGVSLFTSMAIGTIGVVLVSVVGSLTFLPATMSILGDWLNAGRVSTWIPWLARTTPTGPVRGWGDAAAAWLDGRANRQEGAGFWGRFVTAVMARPAVALVVSAAVLLAVASPVLRLRTGISDITAFPASIDGVAGIELVNAKWPSGTDLQLQVVVTNADMPATQTAIEQLKTKALGLQGLSEPTYITHSKDGKVALVSFTMAGGENDEANWALVKQIRGAVDPLTFGSLDGVRTYVTGDAAYAYDVTQVYARGTPTIFLFVLGLSFLLMLVAFHSIVIPIKAILLNLLSTGAAYGVMILVFRDGWLAGPLGVTPGGVIESWVPLFIFTILFGLSMDYHLFILTRIKEARDRGMESRAAIAKGISVTAGTITSAASIMFVVFAFFVSLKFSFIQQLGLGLAVAVLVDASIIRSVLLPATMTLLGDWNWWMPRFLGWIPRVTIEGEPDAPIEASAA